MKVNSIEQEAELFGKLILKMEKIQMLAADMMDKARTKYH